MDIAATTKTTAAQTIASTTLANADNMAFDLVNGVYYAFEFHLLYQSTATTTGLKVAVTGPTATTFVYSAKMIIGGDGTAAHYQGTAHQSGDAITATGVPAANTNYVCLIRGLILPTANGSLQLQIASETGTQVQISAGCIGFLYTPTAKNTSQLSTTSMTPGDATGLTLPVQAGVLYRYRFYIPQTTDDDTVGMGLAVTTPSSSFTQYRVEQPVNLDGTACFFEGAGTSSGDLALKTSNPAIENMMATVDGIVLPTADGNVQLQFSTELAGTAVYIRQGGVGWLDLFDEMPLLPTGRRVVLY